MRRPRSIIFYAWALFAARLALVAGVIAVVLLGGARQRADLTDLYTRAQAAQLTNLTMVEDFLSAQRAMRGVPPARPGRASGTPPGHRQDARPDSAPPGGTQTGAGQAPLARGATPRNPPVAVGPVPPSRGLQPVRGLR